MAIQRINYGAAPDDGTGDPLRVAFKKSDDNFLDLDSRKAEQQNVATALAGKVDKVTGKGLSTNDYTSAEKSKLAGVAAGATANRPDSENVGQLDVGSEPNQVPSTQHLGALAFLDTLGATQITQHTRDSQPGDVWHEWVSNTQLKKKFHGLDGVIRTITETYA